MDRIWIGRKLMQAGPALQARFREDAASTGAAVECVWPIAGDLLRQVGLFLFVGETDYRRPFARTRGVLRFAPDLKPNDLARAFNMLMSITAQYLDNLPGVEPETQALARRALRHAASESLELLKSLRGGMFANRRGGFGGAPLLSFRTKREEPILKAG
jgi:hypothetical protein